MISQEDEEKNKIINLKEKQKQGGSNCLQNMV